MNELSEIAAKWGANGQIELIAERENAVYKILRDGTPMALRLHRAGYQSEAAILSELRWTLRLAEAGFACPKPLAQAGWILIGKVGRWTLCLCDHLGGGRANWGYGHPRWYGCHRPL